MQEVQRLKRRLRLVENGFPFAAVLTGSGWSEAEVQQLEERTSMAREDVQMLRLQAETRVEFPSGNSTCLCSPSAGSETRVRALALRLLNRGAFARVGMAPPSITLNESLWRQSKSVCLESNGKMWADGEKLPKNTESPTSPGYAEATGR